MRHYSKGKRIAGLPPSHHPDRGGMGPARRPGIWELNEKAPGVEPGRSTRALTVPPARSRAAARPARTDRSERFHGKSSDPFVSFLCATTTIPAPTHAGRQSTLCDSEGWFTSFRYRFFCVSPMRAAPDIQKSRVLRGKPCPNPLKTAPELLNIDYCFGFQRRRQRCRAFRPGATRLSSGWLVCCSRSISFRVS